MDRKNNQVVVCAFDMANFAELDRRSISSDQGATRPVFKGPYSVAFNVMSEMAVGREKVNYTSIVEDNFGTFNETTGLYQDGCMAALQQGRADLATLYALFPMTHTGIVHSLPMAEEKIVIISHYTIKNGGKLIDMLNGIILTFDAHLWLAIAAAILVLLFLVKCQMRIECNKNRLKKHPLENTVLYQVLTHIFQVESLDYESYELKFISFIMTFLSFYLFCYLGNLLNTSMVIREKPDVIDSYDDLLNVPILHLYFVPLRSDYKDFEFAPSNSKEHQVRQKSLKHFKREQMFIDSTFVRTFYQVFDQFSSGNRKVKSAALASSLLAPMIRRVMCGSKSSFIFGGRNSKSDSKDALENMLNTHAYLTSDPQSKTKLVGAVYSSNFTSPLFKRIEKRANNFIENGVLTNLIKLIDAPSLPHSEYTEFQHNVYKRCMADRYQDNMDDIDELKKVAIAQLEGSFILIGSIIFVAFHLCWFEICYSKSIYKRKRTKRIIRAINSVR